MPPSPLPILPPGLDWTHGVLAVFVLLGIKAAWNVIDRLMGGDTPSLKDVHDTLREQVRVLTELVQLEKTHQSMLDEQGHRLLIVEEMHRNRRNMCAMEDGNTQLMSDIADIRAAVMSARANHGGRLDRG